MTDSDMVSVVIPNESSSFSRRIDEWLRSIMNDGGESGKKQSQKPKIQKVPRMLREIESNKKCYNPLVVSIGPYHHWKRELESMEKLKITMACQYVKGSGKPIDDLYNKVVQVADEARKCYSEGSTEGFDDEAFTKMMFLDCCFILQFIYCVVNKCEDMKMKSHDIPFVQRDLFLLENQVPFGVLERLMSLRFENDDGIAMINEFIVRTWRLPPQGDSCKKIIKKIISTCSGATQGSPEQKKREFDHPVHLLELSRTQLIGVKALKGGRHQSNGSGDLSSHSAKELINSSRTDGETMINNFIEQRIKKFIFKHIWPVKSGFEDQSDHPNTDWFSYRSAKELRTVGIEIRPGKTRCFKDVKFKSTLLSGLLTLPPITVDDFTKSMLLNLVAYETCPDAPNDYGVTSYPCFLDSLIDQAEDVRELRSKGILHNCLGSDQLVADLFNEIANYLVPNSQAYAEVKAQIERHYRSQIRIWIAEWIHAHFSSPWTFLAFCGVIFVISLSVIQTYLAEFPPKSGEGGK